MCQYKTLLNINSALAPLWCYESLLKGEFHSPSQIEKYCFAATLRHLRAIVFFLHPLVGEHCSWDSRVSWIFFGTQAWSKFIKETHAPSQLVGEKNDELDFS